MEDGIAQKRDPEVDRVTILLWLIWVGCLVAAIVEQNNPHLWVFVFVFGVALFFATVLLEPDSGEDCSMES